MHQEYSTATAAQVGSARQQALVTKGAGLNKHDELFENHTNPLLIDTDFDGVDDGPEVANGTNPLSH